MKVVRFLERKIVIQFFGLALISAPFINTFLHLYLLQKKSGMIWAHFQIWPVLKNIPPLSIFLAFCSVAIGITLLSGAVKAWKYVLVFLGVHLSIQILNINDQAWKGPLAWPSFLLNAGLFFFIFDQLVWKVTSTAATDVENQTQDAVIEREHEPIQENAQIHTPIQNQVQASDRGVSAKVINLKSYRKILFSFGSAQPWGELKTLSSEMLSVLCVAPPPKGIENKVVQIRFARDVVLEIEFHSADQQHYYFKPLNMNKDQVTKLNKWLKKIAV